MQFEQPVQPDRTQPTLPAFQNTLGVDVDPNACQATRLSLSLLHLVLAETFPEHLNIVNGEAIDYFGRHRQHSGTFDVVIANPPFTKWNDLPEAWQQSVGLYMSALKDGKAGMYLAMLSVGLDLVRDGGYVLYVLPHSFLIDDAASKLRDEIHRNFWVRFLVDLHSIQVFGDVKSYVILLILQKKTSYYVEGEDNPRGTIVRCTDFVGVALQRALEGDKVRSDYFDIFDADQSQFANPRWYILKGVGQE